mgnify:CR=1 FL=1
MTLALAAYVYASVQTPEHEFRGSFALFLFFADVWVATAFSPSLQLPTSGTTAFCMQPHLPAVSQQIVSDQ